MTATQQRKLVAWLIAAGAVLVSIGSAEAQVEKLLPNRLPQYWASVSAALGILSVTAGVILWLVSRFPTPVFWNDYECHKAQKKDLKLIYDFARQHFGDDISSLETMRRWYGKNPSVFFVIITEKRKSFEERRRIVGYYCAVPLTESAIAGVESGKIKGSDIPNEYIARVRKECAAIYIGGIAAKGIGAKAALLAYLRKDFTPGKNKWAKKFYTRPITKDGLRIVIKKGFTAINSSSQGEMDVIYKLEL